MVLHYTNSPSKPQFPNSLPTNNALFVATPNILPPHNPSTDPAGLSREITPLSLEYKNYSPTSYVYRRARRLTAVGNCRRSSTESGLTEKSSFHMRQLPWAQVLSKRIPIVTTPYSNKQKSYKRRLLVKGNSRKNPKSWKRLISTRPGIYEYSNKLKSDTGIIWIIWSQLLMDCFKKRAQYIFLSALLENPVENNLINCYSTYLLLFFVTVLTYYYFILVNFIWKSNY